MTWPRPLGSIPTVIGTSQLLRTFPTPRHNARESYGFLSRVARALRLSSYIGPPKFLTVLSARAVSFHPGESNPCFQSLLQGRCWLHLSWEADHSRASLTGPNRVRGILRLAHLPSLASSSRISPARRRVGYMAYDQLP